MSQQPSPSKVAILGGGIGSLSAALGITNDPNWRQRFESITIYQMGWRLGGKGASGRGVNGRIEEHGLHVWMGFYENAFAAIRRVYEELGRPEGTPLATWRDAFKRHDLIELAEYVNESWRLWRLDMEPNDDEPGAGLPIPSMWEHLVRVLGLVKMALDESPHAADPTPREHGLAESVETVLTTFDLTIKIEEENIGRKLMGLAHGVAESLAGHPETHDPKHHDAIAELLDRSAERLQVQFSNAIDDDKARHLFVLADFSIACIRGVLREGLLSGEINFDDLDQYDMVDWLKKHGASDMTCDSGLVHGMYDLMLAYRNGEPDRPSFGAGVFLHFAIRMGLTYRGSVFWKMQAGMGDTIFTPIYEVLKRRGVEFKFFHTVQSLRLSEDGASIGAIDIGRQATLKGGEYDPFVTINDLLCWPSQPRYEQLVEGAELRDQNINLESFWTPWKNVENITLRKGVDFDLVVLGIPVGAHQYICSELINASQAWKDMAEKVETTRTCAMQLWMEPDLEGMGWKDGSPIIDSYVQPFNTWADMSQLIIREQWPENAPVGNVAYFCGPMKGGLPPIGDTEAPGRETESVKQAALEWVKKNCGFLWPYAVTGSGELDWAKLADPESRKGEARFDAQFWRANIDPSERYVLSVPGSTAHRMKANETGFDNLIVSGDWTWSPMNAGCVEGTVMSGMMASNVMLGRPLSEGIVGFDKS